MVCHPNQERWSNLVVGLALAAGLLAAPASAGDWLERGMLAASAADLLSTEHMLRTCPGCYERNPLGSDTGSRVALKVASGALVVAVNRKVAKKHPKAAKVFYAVLIGVYSGATIHNLRQGRR